MVQWKAALAVRILLPTACLGAAPSSLVAALAQQADALFVAVMLLHLTQPSQLLSLARLARSAFGKAHSTSCSAASSWLVDACMLVCRTVRFVAAAASSAQLAQMLRPLSTPNAAGSSAWAVVGVAGALCRVWSCSISVAPSHSLSLRDQYVLDLLVGAAALVGVGISLASLAGGLGLRGVAAAMQLATVALWVSTWMEGRPWRHAMLTRSRQA